jgi:hypothetical protein
MGACNWPESNCKHWEQQQSKPDPFGRVWMHCEEGLTMSNASLARFMSYCLKNNVELGGVHAFAPSYARSTVTAAIRLKPEQFEAFERETGGKLRKPPVIHLN